MSWIRDKSERAMNVKDEKVLVALIAAKRIEWFVSELIDHFKDLSGEETLALLHRHRFNASLVAAATSAGNLENHFVRLGGVKTLDFFTSHCCSQELLLFVQNTLKQHFSSLSQIEMWEVAEQNRFDGHICDMGRERLREHFQGALRKKARSVLEAQNFPIVLCEIAFEAQVLNGRDAHEVIRSTFYRSEKLCALAIPLLEDDNEVIDTLQRCLFSPALHEAALKRLQNWANRLSDEQMIQKILLSGYSPFFKSLFRERLERMLADAFLETAPEPAGISTMVA